MKYILSLLVISSLLLASCGTQEKIEPTTSSQIDEIPMVEEVVMPEETGMNMEDDIESIEEVSSTDIVDIAISSADHTTLVAAIQAWWLVDTLKSEWPFTVFAPTNDAFAALPEWTVETLLESDNLAQLQWILTYHVVPGKVMASDLSDGLVATTVQWDDITFTYENDSWFVNWVAISVANLEGTNGVVHVVDGVLLPPTDS